ncbi:MAG: 16S rRNA (uracil(1498)-N(3))-methyltransferase [Microbacteriaceae bacterium]|nr:16S rRNA (uracil(1498)-N(3))-methyltransferase [Microbacteriaceae bacterium]
MASLYLNESLHPDAFEAGRRLPVGGADARHATQVARIRTGERVAVGDGRGRLAWGRVVHIGQGEFAIEADEIVLAERPSPRLILVQALAKGDRDELAIQAATELGVDEVVPWQASRSVSVWKGDKVAKGLERWRAVVREAAKQAIRPVVPEVGGLVTTKELVASVSAPGLLSEPEASRRDLVLVLEPSALESFAEALRLGPASLAPEAGRITLIVGPEGGIDGWELRELELAGARLVRLGPEVLRTSTAGPAALAALQVLLGRW